MNAQADARNTVIEAIEANGADVASRDDYDIDAIVTEIRDLTGGSYDMEAVEPDVFWAIVERFAKTSAGPRITFEAFTLDRGNSQVAVRMSFGGDILWSQEIPVRAGIQGYTSDPYIMSVPPVADDLTYVLSNHGWHVNGTWEDNGYRLCAAVHPAQQGGPEITLPAAVLAKITAR